MFLEEGFVSSGMFPPVRPLKEARALEALQWMQVDLDSQSQRRSSLAELQLQVQP